MSESQLDPGTTIASTPPPLSHRRATLWKPELYKLQLEAPTPKIVSCTKNVERPIFFGPEYHGVISHKEAAALLSAEPDGSYIVRKGSESNPFYTMSWRFNNEISHFKLYYDGRYYVKEKRYESMYELTSDGLIQRHIQIHGAQIVDMMHEKVAYQESPYVTLNRQRLRTISGEKNGALDEKKSILIGKLGVENKNLESPIDKAPDKNKKNNECNILINKSDKKHPFKIHNFKGLNWCEFCANFLWGFTAQGVKCEDCGFIAHSKCSRNVPPMCMPDLKKLRGVFGIDLTTLLNLHSSTLPFVVKKCVKEIEIRGMEQEGIYRISGFADEIEALKMEFDLEGEAANLGNYSNINVVAGCLKLYLRLLPVPLLTHKLHQGLIDATFMKTPAEQIAALRETLTGLPPAHYNTLQYMIQHLHSVSLLSNVNKMTALNLSTVFAPTLMAMPPQCTDLSQEIHVLELLILHSVKIFGP